MNYEIHAHRERLAHQYAGKIAEAEKLEAEASECRDEAEAMKATLDAFDVVLSVMKEGVQLPLEEPQTETPAAAEVARQIIADLGPKEDIAAPWLREEIRKRSGVEVKASTMSHFLRRMYEDDALIQIEEGRGSRAAVYRKKLSLGRFSALEVEESVEDGVPQ